MAVLIDPVACPFARPTRKPGSQEMKTRVLTVKSIFPNLENFNCFDFELNFFSDLAVFVSSCAIESTVARMSGDLKPSDYEIPAASVNRLIKAALSDNIQMTKDARAAFVRAISVFIFYITHGANDFSREAKRQTIYPTDVINALK